MAARTHVFSVDVYDTERASDDLVRYDLFDTMKKAIAHAKSCCTQDVADLNVDHDGDEDPMPLATFEERLYSPMSREYLVCVGEDVVTRYFIQRMKVN